MAYNNYFPYYYPQYAPQGYSGQSGSNYGTEQGNTYTPSNGSQNGFIWVQGETGAKAYPVAPNCTVQLWDSEAQVVYLKSADASGMPSMKVLDYTIREQAGQTPAVNLSGYVTREEFEKVIKEIRNESAVQTVRSAE